MYPFLQPLATTHPLSVSMDLPVQDASQPWSHSLCVLLCLLLLPSIVSQGPSMWSVRASLLLMAEYSLIAWLFATWLTRHLLMEGLFSASGWCGSCCWEHSCTRFV